ncbi:FldA protein [Advenella faeciporci]|uniref:FldA protein n=1 Tax=Advenella faeciporci TaxID=797535 RepID=A0A918JQN9_9BURK|nr:4-oxalomesaconate tautomerase [Advenella faeciporci]NLY33588.1 4-oxalomesaconate tautomerase [Alcaligenaceae bacterium]GGW94502.1 FldA protein [Advenella faeciporci]
MPSQYAIPCILMRGGTSKGPFFYAGDLPKDTVQRDKVLLAALGSPDKRQIDGIGGAHSLTSKVGIVDICTTGQADLSFLFAQLQPEKDTVDTTPNCGNMLAGVVPFALERKLIAAQGDVTKVRVLTLNTNMVSEIEVQTPGGEITYEGNARIDGVPGTSSPVKINFLDVAGSVCGSLLPTGNLIDTFEIEGIGSLQATCIDNGMPMVLVRAQDVSRTAYEPVAQLNQDTQLKTIIEDLRLKAAQKMGLGDVSNKNYPKMCLLNKPLHGGAIHTRCYIPHVCHDAIGVLAAVTVATACVLPDTVAQGLADEAGSDGKLLAIEHPSGEFSVELTLNPEDKTQVLSAALLRTARPIMQGEILVARSLIK